MSEKGKKSWSVRRRRGNLFRSEEWDENPVCQKKGRKSRIVRKRGGQLGLSEKREEIAVFRIWGGHFCLGKEDRESLPVIERRGDS